MIPLSDVERSIVYHQPDRFAGWPANYGLWAWGDELVAVFVSGWLGPLTGVHARDKGRPFLPVQMRSADAGRSWTEESWNGTIPGGRDTLSGDEHVDPELQVAPTLSPDAFVPLDDPIDFTDPETIVMCARTGLDAGSWSWFHVSRDRGRHWSGPHLIPDLGTNGISARTDIVALSSDSALMMLTCPKVDGTEGRVCAALVTDGGRSFERRGWVDEAPEGWHIMPSSLRHGDEVLTAVRAADGQPKTDRRHWIDLHRSSDGGISWHPVATAVSDTGVGGNPPALLRLADQRLLIVYGHRDIPFGLRCVTSDDDGRSWSEPVVLTDDIAMRDMGYPRAVQLDDGSVLAVYYANRGDETDRWIEAVRWRP